MLGPLYYLFAFEIASTGIPSPFPSRLSSSFSQRLTRKIGDLPGTAAAHKLSLSLSVFSRLVSRCNTPDPELGLSRGGR